MVRLSERLKNLSFLHAGKLQNIFHTQSGYKICQELRERIESPLWDFLYRDLWAKLGDQLENETT